MQNIYPIIFIAICTILGSIPNIQNNNRKRKHGAEEEKDKVDINTGRSILEDITPSKLKNVNIVKSIHERLAENITVTEVRNAFGKLKKDIKIYHHDKKGLAHDCQMKIKGNSKYRNPEFEIFSNAADDSSYKPIGFNYTWNEVRAELTEDSEVEILLLEGIGSLAMIDIYQELMKDGKYDDEICKMDFGGLNTSEEPFFLHLKEKRTNITITTNYKDLTHGYIGKMFYYYKNLIYKKDFLYSIYPPILLIEYIFFDFDFSYEEVKIENVIELFGWLHVLNVYLEYYYKKVEEESKKQFQNLKDNPVICSKTSVDQDKVFTSNIDNIVVRMVTAIKPKKSICFLELYKNYAKYFEKPEAEDLSKKIFFVGDLDQNAELIKKYEENVKNNKTSLPKYWLYKQFIMYFKVLWEAKYFYEDSLHVWDTFYIMVENILNSLNFELDNELKVTDFDRLLAIDQFLQLKYLQSYKNKKKRYVKRTITDMRK